MLYGNLPSITIIIIINQQDNWNLSILENTVSISVEGVESGQMDDKDVEEARSVVTLEE